MSDIQVAETAVLLLENHPNAKMPDDFILAFKRIKQGVYGTFYGGIDGMAIGEKVKQYFEDKQTEVVAINMAKSKEQKDAEKEITALPAYELKPLPPVSEWFKPREIQPQKPREISEDQKLFNDFLKRFDALYKMFPVKYSANGKELKNKFIKRYGAVMDIQAFINFKAEQYFRVNQYLDNRA